MTVQKTPDRLGDFDPRSVRWEQDLKPFRRLPRTRRPDTQQRVPAVIPLLVSFTVVTAACALTLNFINQNRPALTLALPTATLRIITPTPTEFVPPTATPYIAPTDTPTPQPEPSQGGTPKQIGIGARVVIVNTGGNGLNFRRAPTISAERIRALPEGNTYEIVGGPEQADGFTWWQLRDPSDGTIGWGVQNYMALAP
ncbi:MAG: SH3 domain-containing protein [Thermoflexales bacterium]|nr:SH3 domain-containing protein [Thermoflexales bacterium]